MIKQLTAYFDYTLFAEAALVIFALVFLAIVIRTLLLSRDTTREQANIVFDDKREKQK
jgi:hypothetical protein